MRDEVVQIERRKRPFAQLPNALLRDSRLSAKATGVLCYLLSHSDEWEVRMSDVRERFHMGRDSWRAAMKELRTAGYAVLRVLKNAKGDFCGKRYGIREVPTEGSISRRSENRPLNNTSYYLKNTNARASRPGQSAVFGNGEVALSKAVERYAKFTVEHRWHQGVKGSNRNGWERATLKQWDRAYRELLERAEPSRVKEVLVWYFGNWDTAYVPRARTLKSFCDKFDRIEDAMDRERHRQNGEEPTHRRSITNEYDEE